MISSATVDVDAAVGCREMDVIAAQSSWLEENGEIKIFHNKILPFSVMTLGSGVFFFFPVSCVSRPEEITLSALFIYVGNSTRE